MINYNIPGERVIRVGLSSFKKSPLFITDRNWLGGPSDSIHHPCFPQGYTQLNKTGGIK